MESAPAGEATSPSETASAVDDASPTAKASADEDAADAASAEPAEETAGTREVYVQIFQDGGENYDTQRPVRFSLTEFETFNDLNWSHWGPDSATGQGNLSGTWCMPKCLDRPYPATLTITDPVKVGDTWYFSRYDISNVADPPADLSASERTTIENSGGPLEYAVPARP
ncbi:hypothetical protein [Salinactinospora qingdaonensis]|uniref:hypothetical protein n=1 Tax=Salinactinospora qingdaonensis TaxID=702744 RepID=UPI0031EAE66E